MALVGSSLTGVRSQTRYIFAKALATEWLSISSSMMKSTTPTRIKIRRFITDRYAYRTQPDYLPELIAFGVVLAVVSWPIFLLASAFAGTLK